MDRAITATARRRPHTQCAIPIAATTIRIIAATTGIITDLGSGSMAFGTPAVAIAISADIVSIGRMADGITAPVAAVAAADSTVAEVSTVAEASTAAVADIAVADITTKSKSRLEDVHR